MELPKSNLDSDTKPVLKALATIIPSVGWYVVWGPTSETPGLTQLVVCFGLDKDGFAIVPIIVDRDGNIVSATSFGADYTLEHPRQNLTYVGLGT